MKNTLPINNIIAEGLGNDIFLLLPDFIELETSTYCNRVCAWCPNSIYDRSKTQQLIERDLFSKIIKELKMINYSGQLALHNFNEPLFDPLLFENIRCIREELTRSRITIFTNGDVLTSCLCRELERSGVSTIVVSLHDAIYNDDPHNVLETHLKRMELCDIFTDVSDRLGRKYKISYGDLSIVYYIPYMEMLTSRGGIIPGMDKNNKSEICFLPFSSCAIDFQGQMKVCCEIYPNDPVHEKVGIIGNLKDAGFLDLWFSDIYNNLRKEFLRGNSYLEVCQHCPQNGREIDRSLLEKWKALIGS